MPSTSSSRFLDLQLPKRGMRGGVDIRTSPPAKPTTCPKLEGCLFDLALSSSQAKFASIHGLYYDQGKVQVVIELQSSDEALLSKYSLQVEGKYEDLVQALVPVETLCQLSSEPEVRLVRVPFEASPGRK